MPPGQLEQVRRAYGRWGAQAKVQALAERNNLNTAEVDDVIWGTSSQRGKQGSDMGRMAALDAGFDVRASGVTTQQLIDGRIGNDRQRVAHTRHRHGVVVGAEHVVAGPAGELASAKLQLGPQCGVKRTDRQAVLEAGGRPPRALEKPEVVERFAQLARQ